MGPHHVDAAITFLEADYGDVVFLGEGLDGLAEPVPHLLHDRGRGDGLTEVVAHEGDHLAGDLEIRHIHVEVDPIKALEVEGHMVVE